jgi:hypothetical protein
MGGCCVTNIKKFALLPDAWEEIIKPLQFPK